ncbi:toprim domain-containing protein [Streptomyces sp. NPDC059994]|uniref:toprim domain-containing protein n=1 Tax=Streptomyces sp. NPDC059994 TaxID=3347029 RepID=UPI0036AD321C
MRVQAVEWHPRVPLPKPEGLGPGQALKVVWPADDANEPAGSALVDEFELTPYAVNADEVRAFPATLREGESAVQVHADGWQFTGEHGHCYRLVERPWGRKPGGTHWSVTPLPQPPSGSGSRWIGELHPPLETALDWMRRDGASRALAAGRWQRHPLAPAGTYPFSLDLHVDELEEGMWRVVRYGHEGRIARYPWGYETGQHGGLPENQKTGGMKWDYAVWSATARGFEEFPTERLRIVGSHWGTREDCAPGGPRPVGFCKRQHPRFLVEVEGHGRVVICAEHMMDRIMGDDAFRSYYSKAAKISGYRTWSYWQDRARELTWDLIAPAADRGEPLPDVAAALLAEAEDMRMRRDAKDAATAAKSAAKASTKARRGGPHPQRTRATNTSPITGPDASALSPGQDALFDAPLASTPTTRTQQSEHREPPSTADDEPQHQEPLRIEGGGLQSGSNEGHTGHNSLTTPLPSESDPRYRAVRLKGGQGWIVEDQRDHSIPWVVSPTGAARECMFGERSAESEARTTAHRLNTELTLQIRPPDGASLRYTRPPQGSHIGVVAENITVLARIVDPGTSSETRGMRSSTRQRGRKTRIIGERPAIAVTPAGNTIEFWHQDGMPALRPGQDFHVAGMVLKHKRVNNQQRTVLASVSLDTPAQHFDRRHLHRAAPTNDWTAVSASAAGPLGAGQRVRIRDPDSPYRPHHALSTAAYATVTLEEQRPDGSWRSQAPDGRHMIITRRDVRAVEATEPSVARSGEPSPAPPTATTGDIPEPLRSKLITLRYHDLCDRWESHIRDGDDVLLISEPHTWQPIAEAKPFVFVTKDGRHLNYHSIIARRRDGIVTLALDFPQQSSPAQDTAVPARPPIGGPIRELDTAGIIRELKELDDWRRSAAAQAHDSAVAATLVQAEDRCRALARARDNRRRADSGTSLPAVQSERLPPLVDQQFTTTEDLIAHLASVQARPHLADRAAEERQAAFCRSLARRPDAPLIVHPAAQGRLAVVQIKPGNWQVRTPHLLHGLGAAARVTSRRHAAALAEAMAAITDVRGTPFPWSDPWADRRAMTFRDANGHPLIHALEQLRTQVPEPPEPDDDDVELLETVGHTAANGESEDHSAPASPHEPHPGWSNPLTEIPILGSAERTETQPEQMEQPAAPESSYDQLPHGALDPTTLTNPWTAAAQAVPLLAGTPQPQQPARREATAPSSPEAATSPDEARPGSATTGEARTPSPDSSRQQADHVHEHPERTASPQAVSTGFADTELRPGRLLFAAGTPVVVHAATADGDDIPAISTGAADPPWGTGQWQAVRHADGSEEAIHPALISLPGQPRFAGLTDPAEIARWETLDRAEAAGSEHADLPVEDVVLSDQLVITRRSGGKDRTGLHGLTAIRLATRGTSRRPRRGREFHYQGRRGAITKVFHQEDTLVRIGHPLVHPSVNSPTDGRPLTTRLLKERYLEGPQSRRIHDVSTLELIADGQFALHRALEGWELLPASTALRIWPPASLRPLAEESDCPWPLATLASAEEAKDFAGRLLDRFARTGPHGIDFASPDLPAYAAAWCDSDGGPLYLALLRERALFDRVQGRADSFAATTYALFEPTHARKDAPAAAQWADQLRPGHGIALTDDGGDGYFTVREHHLAANGLVTLTLDNGERVTTARNTLIATDDTELVTDLEGTPYGDRQATWAVHEGWLELNAQDMDPETARALRLPYPVPLAAVIRGRMTARDDATDSLRLADVRLLTSDGRRHPLHADQINVPTPDTVIRLRDQASAQEAAWYPPRDTPTPVADGRPKTPAPPGPTPLAADPPEPEQLTLDMNPAASPAPRCAREPSSPSPASEREQAAPSARPPAVLPSPSPSALGPPKASPLARAGRFPKPAAPRSPAPREVRPPGPPDPGPEPREDPSAAAEDGLGRRAPNPAAAAAAVPLPEASASSPPRGEDQQPPAAIPAPPRPVPSRSRQAPDGAAVGEHTQTLGTHRAAAPETETRVGPRDGAQAALPTPLPAVPQLSADRAHHRGGHPSSTAGPGGLETTPPRAGVANAPQPPHRPPPAVPPHPRDERAQQLADQAASATSAAQVRALWEQGSVEHVPAQTIVSTPLGAAPLSAYLHTRGEQLAHQEERTAGSRQEPPTDKGTGAKARRPAIPTSPTGAADASAPPGRPPVLRLPDGRSHEATDTAAGQLHRDLRAAVEEPKPALAPRLYGHLHGQPIYIQASDERPPVDAAPPDPARWLYLGLSESGSDQCIAYLSSTDLAAMQPALLLTAATTWAQARRPVFTNLRGLAPGQSEFSAVTTRGPDAAPTQAGDTTDPGQGESAPRVMPSPTPPPKAVPEATTATTNAKPDMPRHPTPAIISTPAPPTGSPQRVGHPGSTTSSPPEAHSPDASPASRRPLDAVTAPQPADAPGKPPSTPESTANPGHVTERLLATAQKALSGLGIPPDLVATHADKHQLVVTHPTTGDAVLDAEAAHLIRRSVNELITETDDRELARHAINISITQQKGQKAFSSPPASRDEAQGTQAAQDRLYRLLDGAAAYFAADLSSDSAEAKEAVTYLTQTRGHALDGELVARWGVGHARRSRQDTVTARLRAAGFSDQELLQAGLLRLRPETGTLNDAFFHRLMWPVRDLDGRVIGFTGRTLGDPTKWKYSNTASDSPHGPTLYQKSKVLLGMERLRDTEGPVYLAEGPFDVLAVDAAHLHADRPQHAVLGTCGTALTADHVRMLRQACGRERPLILVRDNDTAGARSILRAWHLLATWPAPVHVVTPEAAKDLAEIHEDPNRGPTEVLRQLDNQRQPLLDAVIEADLTLNGAASHGGSQAAGPANAASLVANRVWEHLEASREGEPPRDELESLALKHAGNVARPPWNVPLAETLTAILLGPSPQSVDAQWRKSVSQRAEALTRAVAHPAAPLPLGENMTNGSISGKTLRESTVSGIESESSSVELPTPAAASQVGRAPSDQARSASPATLGSDFEMALAPAGQSPYRTDNRNVAAARLSHELIALLDGFRLAQRPNADQPRPYGTLRTLPFAISAQALSTDDPSLVIDFSGARQARLVMTRAELSRLPGSRLLAALEWQAAIATAAHVALTPAWFAELDRILPGDQLDTTITKDEFLDLLHAFAALHQDNPQAPDLRTRADRAVALFARRRPAEAMIHLADAGHRWIRLGAQGWTYQTSPDPVSAPSTAPAPAPARDFETVAQDIAELRAECEALDEAAAASRHQPPPEEMWRSGTPAQPLPADNPQIPVEEQLNAEEAALRMRLESLRPHEQALPPGLYSSITALVEQIEATLPKIRRLHDRHNHPLMNRGLRLLVRTAEVLSSLATRLHLPDVVSRSIERLTSYLRGAPRPGAATPLDQLAAPSGDRRMQDLSHNQRAIEAHLAAPGIDSVRRAALQEDWIINRAQWFARYEQQHRSVPGDLVPGESRLVAGAPPLPNIAKAYEDLIKHLRARAVALRNSDANDPRADLFTRAATAYEMLLAGKPAGRGYPAGLITPTVLREAALAVVRHRTASPLVVQSAFDHQMPPDVANHTLQLLEARGIVGPLTGRAPRAVIVRGESDVDKMLANPIRPHSAEPARPAPRRRPIPKPATPDPIEDILQQRTASLTETAARRLGESKADPRPARPAAPVTTGQEAHHNARPEQHAELQSHRVQQAPPKPEPTPPERTSIADRLQTADTSSPPERRIALSQDNPRYLRSQAELHRARASQAPTPEASKRLHAKADKADRLGGTPPKAADALLEGFTHTDGGDLFRAFERVSSQLAELSCQLQEECARRGQESAAGPPQKNTERPNPSDRQRQGQMIPTGSPAAASTPSK